MDDINAKKPDPINRVTFQVNKHPKEVYAPEHLLRQLHSIEDSLSQQTGSYPYRHQIQLNALAEALAVLRGGSEITQEDIDMVSLLSKWINYDFNGV